MLVLISWNCPKSWLCTTQGQHQCLSLCRLLVGAAWSFRSTNKQASHLHFFTEMITSWSLSLISKMQINSYRYNQLQFHWTTLHACLYQTVVCYLHIAAWYILAPLLYQRVMLYCSSYLQILITTVLVTIMMSIITSYQLVNAVSVRCGLDSWLCGLADLYIATVAHSKSDCCRLKGVETIFWPIPP